jgi:GT2 family glycosyltransferase
MKKVKVSFVIVFFDKFAVLKKTLLNLRNHASIYPFEVIIVNNGNRDIQKETARVLPNVIYMKSPRNIGYGAGNNLGVSKSKGEYIFVLNPDTRLEEGTLNSLVSFLDKNKKAAVVAPCLLYPNKRPYKFQGSRLLTPIRGIFAHSFINKLFPNNPISKTYFLKDTQPSNVLKVNAVPGR